MFVAAVLALGLSSAASSAATVTVGGTVWDISTLTGTFSELSSVLIGQTWWGDNPRAVLFADELGNNLGFPNAVGRFGPYFAVGFFPVADQPDGLLSATLQSTGGIQLFGLSYSSQQNIVLTWAVATTSQVPLPAGGVLLVTGLASVVGMGKLRKRALAHVSPVKSAPWGPNAPA